MGTIVVGIDGSEQSRSALRWAVEEARVRGSSVEAVYAYEHTPVWGAYHYGTVGEDPDRVREREARLRERAAHEDAVAHRRAQTLIREVVDDVATPAGVSVSAAAVQDRRPAHALVARSQDAELLVVGSRGRGGFAGLLLGSVSQQCAQHAACPVVIHTTSEPAVA